jgi:hypothetical protein
MLFLIHRQGNSIDMLTYDQESEEIKEMSQIFISGKSVAKRHDSNMKKPFFCVS